jgi:hypothetical protein
LENFRQFFTKHILKNKNCKIALMGAASPDLEKQGFFAVVFVDREYSGQQD